MIGSFSLGLKKLFKKGHVEQLLRLYPEANTGLAVVVNEPERRQASGTALLLHGFWTGKSSKTNLALVPLLTAAGITTIRFDFRGHDESDGEMADMAVSRDALDSLFVVDTVLRRHPQLERLPLFGLGSSYGGSVLLAMLSKCDFLAVAFKSPVSDYAEVLTLQLGTSGMQAWKDAGITRLGDGDDAVSLGYAFVADAVSLDLYGAARSSQVNACIVHGTSDEEVPIGQSRRLAASFEGARLIEIEGADHEYSNPDHFNRTIKYLFRFLTSQLRQ